MRRTLVAAVVAIMLAAACSGGDSDGAGGSDPDDTTTVTTASTDQSSTTTSTEGSTSLSFPDPPIVEPEFEDLSLLRCLEPECTRIQKVKLDEQQIFEGFSLPASVVDQQVMERSDGRPLVLVDWFKPHLEDDGWDDEMVLYSCVDVACSSVTEQLVLTGANDWFGALMPDGSLAISYQTGQGFLCGPEGCADPARADLSSFELLLCPDPDDCSPSTGRIVVLDRQGIVGRWGGHVVVGANDAPVVLYEREIGPDVAEVHLARCSDPRCTDVTVSLVAEPEKSDLNQATTTPDGSPVFLRLRMLSGSQEHHVVACSDPACSSTSVPISFENRTFEDGEMAGGVAVDADGRLVVAVWKTPGPQLTTVSCADIVCGSPALSPVLADFERDAWENPTMRLTPDGLPQFTIGLGAPEMGEELELMHIVCHDPDCSSATTTRVNDPARYVDEWDPNAPLGLMAYLLVTPLTP